MRESSKAALGGIVASLAIVIMLITYVSPFLVYTAPTFAGFLLIIIISEMGYKWAFGVYAVVSVLSVFLIADKESAVFYTMFFGYFPIIDRFLTEKIKAFVPKLIIKLIIFNISTCLSLFICAYVFNVDYSEFQTYGKMMLAATWVMLNVLFLLYDFLLQRLNFLYDIKIKPQLRKMFHH